MSVVWAVESLAVVIGLGGVAVFAGNIILIDDISKCRFPTMSRNFDPKQPFSKPLRTVAAISPKIVLLISLPNYIEGSECSRRRISSPEDHFGLCTLGV